MIVIEVKVRNLLDIRVVYLNYEDVLVTKNVILLSLTVTTSTELDYEVIESNITDTMIVEENFRQS